MSEKITYKLNGNQANPKNREQLAVQLNFDKDKPTVQERISLNEFVFVNEDHEAIRDYIEQGMAGTGPGVCQGLPFKIKASKGTTNKTLFDGMLNLRKSSFTTVESRVQVLEKKGVDWLTEVADTVTFERMYEETGEITDNDWIDIPYILNSVPDYKEAAICALTASFIATELGNRINELKKLAAKLSNPFEATAIIQAVLEILYIIALIISLVKLIKDMILFIIQPVKYHAGMKAKTLWEKGCLHFGLTFKSEIFDAGSPFEHLVYIPPKQAQQLNPTEPRIFNFTVPDKTKQRGYYKGTFGQFIRDMKETLAGKIQIRKNISTGNMELHFMREDKNLSTPQFTIPEVYSPNLYDQEYSYNLDEFVTNYSVTFQTDVTDKNTIQNYSGVSCSAFLECSSITDQEYKLMAGYRQINIPFARAHRKESLTVPETICNTLVNTFSTLINGVISAVNVIISAVNFIIKVINSVSNALNVIGINVKWKIQSIPSVSNPNLNNLIGNRIGMMIIETDSFAIPKIAVLDIANNPKNTKISIHSASHVDAEYLYDAFHFVRSYYPSTEHPHGNQRKMLQLQNVPFTFDNYLQVLDSNKAYWNIDGVQEEVELTSCDWNPHEQKANIFVRIPWTVIKNLVLTKYTADGK